MRKSIRCKACRKSFEPHAAHIKWCSDECRDEVVRQLAAVQIAKRDKASKKELKELRDKHKDRGYYMGKLQEVFNRFIRLRDGKEPCISCGTTKPVMMSAGHFFTVGSYPNLRFNEDNVHKQCWYNCNSKKSGNLAEYRPRLIRKIGEERFAQLEALKNEPLRLTLDEIKEKIEYYKMKCKELTDSR